MDKEARLFWTEHLYQRHKSICYFIYGFDDHLLSYVKMKLKLFKIICITLKEISVDFYFSYNLLKSYVHLPSLLLNIFCFD